MDVGALTDSEFSTIREFLLKETGISLTSEKKPLVCCRLYKRLEQLGMTRFADYFSYIMSPHDPSETQSAIDLLTTNETYFYREPQHFRYLSELIRHAPRDQIFRVWSAACSSGEEPYTIAMVLQEAYLKGSGPDWEVRGSDISTRVLDIAANGLYSLDRMDDMPRDLLRHHCLKGTGSYEGTMLVNKSIRDKVEFAQINLIEPLPLLVPFDAIFLRNVMIYFDLSTRRNVIRQLLSVLKPEGVLFIGLAENLQGIQEDLVSIGPGIYRRERRK